MELGTCLRDGSLSGMPQTLCCSPSIGRKGKNQLPEQVPEKPQLADMIQNIPSVDPLAAFIPGTQIIYQHLLLKHWLTTEPLRSTTPLAMEVTEAALRRGLGS